MTKITIDIPEAYLLREREICIRVSDNMKHTAVVPHHQQPVVSPSRAAALSSSDSVPTLEHYAQRLVAEFRKKGQLRLVETYVSAVNSFRHHMGSADIALASLTPTVIEDYEQRMAARGLSPNTRSFYLRILRALYNRAVGEGLTADQQPFAHVFTGKARTRKRALPLPALRRLAAMTATGKGGDRARWLFLFSFYTRGMSFVDIAHLRKSDLRDGHLTYRRRKTGQLLRIAWRPEMQAIAERLPSLDGVHLLGILDNTRPNTLRQQCHSRQYCINKSLKRLGQLLGLAQPLTMYVARHSWASLARQLDIPLSVISDSMGHTSEKTTRIYLAALDEDKLDRANDLVLKAISGT